MTTWRLQDAERGLAPPDLLLQGLLGRFEFQRGNLVAYSEEPTASPWVWGGFEAQATAEPATGATVTDLVTPAEPERVTERAYRPEQRPGFLYQDVGVIEGQLYNYTFHFQPLLDIEKARFAVTDAQTGAFIVEPLPYTLQPVGSDAAGYRRLGAAFRVPEGVSVVRIWALYPAALIQTSVGAEAATYRVTHPQGMVRETRTVTVAGQTYEIGVARIRSQDE